MNDISVGKATKRRNVNIKKREILGIIYEGCLILSVKTHLINDHILYEH